MEKDVTRGIEEQLSAFLDGELPDEEVALLIRRLDREESYRETLASYAAVGSVLRGEATELAALNVRAGVRAGIAATDEATTVVASPDVEHDEPAGQTASGQSTMLPFAAAAGLAVAAVAALLVTVGGPDAPSGSLADGGVPQLQAAAQTEVAALPVNTAVTGNVSAEEAVRIAAAERRVRLNRERMTSYLISHGEQSRSFPGSFADSRMYVQQASFSE